MGWITRNPEPDPRHVCSPPKPPKGGWADNAQWFCDECRLIWVFKGWFVKWETHGEYLLAPTQVSAFRPHVDHVFGGVT